MLCHAHAALCCDICLGVTCCSDMVQVQNLFPAQLQSEQALPVNLQFEVNGILDTQQYAAEVCSTQQYTAEAQLDTHDGIFGGCGTKGGADVRPL